MAKIYGAEALTRKLTIAAQGVDVTREMKEAAGITRDHYVDSIKDIQGTRLATRYSPKRTVVVSDPGQTPNNDTGELVRNTSVGAIRKNTVQVLSAAEHAIPLEYGTNDMAPRPAMHPAFKMTQETVVARIAAAVSRRLRRVYGGG